MAIEKVLECMPQMVVRCDERGKIIYANSKYVKCCGREEENTWLKNIHPSELEETKEKWEQHVSENVPFEITHRIRNVAGEYRWHRSNSSRYDGEQIDYLLTSTDIHKEVTLTSAFASVPNTHASNTNKPNTNTNTNTNTSSSACGSREEAFERRILHSADPILTVNASDSKILSVNNAVKLHFQYSPAELIGKPCTVLMEDKSGFRHLGENGYFEKFKRRIVPGHTSIGFSRQIQAKRKDGKLLSVNFMIDCYVQGDLNVYIVVLRPIDPEVTMQQQINKSKDAFLSTISHELRTPLFGLLGTISLLHSQIMDPNTLDDVTQMEINVMSLLSIVNNMIDFYLLHQLNTVPVYLPFDTSKLVADICDRMGGFKQADVEFTYETETPSLLVSDPNFIEHVLVNLLSNALRFTHSGKVEVKVALVDKDESSASITLLPGQGVLQITVIDTGIGIEPEFYPQLFQPFTQLDNSDQREYKGVGLGLAITRSVVDMLGGAISFTSTVGRGSEFQVTIPVELIQYPPNSPESPIPDTPSPQLTDVLAPFDLSIAPPQPGQPRKRRLSSPLLTQFLYPEEKPQPRTALRSKSLSLPTIHSPSAMSAPTCPFSAMMSPGSSSQEIPSSLSHTPLPSTPEISESPTSSPPHTPPPILCLPPFDSSPRPLTPPPHLQISSLRPPTPPVSLLRPKSPPPIQVRPKTPPPSPNSLRKFRSSPTLHTPESEQTPSPRVPSPTPSPSKVTQKVNDQERGERSSQQIGSLRKCVLVVEDNPMNQLVIKRMLERLECQVVLAKHGGEALEILFDTESDKYVGYHKFDTILADCQMPVMDGYQATQHIRDWEALQRGSLHMLILALSASISAENEAKCLESGMDGFIAKPVTVSMLYHYLASYYSLVDMQNVARATAE